jgi:hypothetical protein
MLYSVSDIDSSLIILSECSDVWRRFKVSLYNCRLIKSDINIKIPLILNTKKSCYCSYSIVFILTIKIQKLIRPLRNLSKITLVHFLRLYFLLYHLMASFVDLHLIRSLLLRQIRLVCSIY